jgi:hypothetical protein
MLSYFRFLAPDAAAIKLSGASLLAIAWPRMAQFSAVAAA